MVVDQFGARRAMALGGFGNTIMLSLYWLIATERWKIHDIELLILVLSTLGVLTFVGCALVTGSVFKVIVESCGSGTKGKAVGCAKGYVGVGSGVYVCIFGALFGSSGSGGGAVGPALLGVTEESAKSFPAVMKLASMLPTSTLATLSNPLVASLTSASGGDDVPTTPELNSLNFLLMASVISFLAAVLPALFLLPKQSATSSPCQIRRDGTRNIHFRVIYAGLIMLGMWVVGMSLAELREEEEKAAQKAKNSSGTNEGVAPTVVNATNLSKLELDNVGDTDTDAQMVAHLLEGFSLEEESSEELASDTTTIDSIDIVSSNTNQGQPPISYARRLYNNAKRKLSSSAPERHWGTAFFLLLLWWGPALSLLVIPPRKETTDHEILEETSSNIEYDNEDETSNRRHGRFIDENEEETFLQDDVGTSAKALSLEKGRDSQLGQSGEINVTMIQMLRTGKAWLMAWTFVILVGGGSEYP